MTVRLYKSTDGSAPVLTGQAGKLTDLLDAILVNGYGSQTAAGWTIAFTTTNKRVYTMAAGGTGFSLQVDDAAPTTAKEARATGFETPSSVTAGTGQFPTNAQVAIGTAPAGAEIIRKSNTADATARAWYCIADGHTLYLFIETGDATAPFASYPFMFGDFFSYNTSDVWACSIIGRVIENSLLLGPTTISSSSGQAQWYDCFGQLSLCNETFMNNVLPGHYAARAFTGVGGSSPFGKHTDQAAMGFKGATANCTPAQQLGYLGTWAYGTTPSNFTSNTPGLWATEFNYPNPADSGLYFAPIYVNQTGGRRGYMKGLWAPLQHMPLNHGDTFSGTGNMAGKSFIAMNVIGASSWVNSINPVAAPCQVFVEYSNTWS